jgi:hypothetical protein
MERVKKPQWRYNHYQPGDAYTVMKGGITIHVVPKGEEFEYTVGGYTGSRNLNKTGTAKTRAGGQQAGLKLYKNLTTSSSY